MAAKIKRKIQEIVGKIAKRPEEAAFVFLAGVAIVFAGMCFGLVKSDIQSAQNGVSLATDIEANAASRLEKKLKKMIADSPMKEMAPYIAKRDKKTAAYLVAIAKKESDWGKYSPKKKGKECFNFWGYKGKRNRNAAGYSCFETPAQAVNVVGKRIDSLIAQKTDTPAEMVIWKCGSACTARSNPDAAKWVSDVAMYFKKIYN
jgi:hypothetical protein